MKCIPTSHFFGKAKPIHIRLYIKKEYAIPLKAPETSINIKNNYFTSCRQKQQLLQLQILKKQHILQYCRWELKVKEFCVFVFIELLRRVTRGVEGGEVSPALFQKLEKSALICQKNALIVVIYG